MTEVECKDQIIRLRQQYGAQSFSNERFNLIFKELSWVPGHVFRFWCDDFIGNNRMPPMLKDFQVKAAKYRESLHRREAAGHQRDAESVMSGKTLMPEHAAERFQIIGMRLAGNYDDRLWAEFLNKIDESSSQKEKGHDHQERQGKGQKAL